VVTFVNATSSVNVYVDGNYECGGSNVGNIAFGPHGKEKNKKK
jgi:spore coat protein U-like protein